MTREQLRLRRIARGRGPLAAWARRQLIQSTTAALRAAVAGTQPNSSTTQGR